MCKPHKHAAIIKAWADGAEIQVKDKLDTKWQDIKNPVWHTERVYRIKPEPKPDSVRYAKASSDDKHFVYPSNAKSTTFWSITQTREDNVMAIFDGETGKLKAVEMI